MVVWVLGLAFVCLLESVCLLTWVVGLMFTYCWVVGLKILVCLMEFGLGLGCQCAGFLFDFV